MMTNRGKVLVVDDSDGWREEIKEMLQDEGFEVVTAHSKRTALSMLASESFEAAIIDVNLADEMANVDGLIINRHIQKTAPGTKVILVSGDSLTDRQLNDILPASFLEKSKLWSQLNLLLKR